MTSDRVFHSSLVTPPCPDTQPNPEEPKVDGNITFADNLVGFNRLFFNLDAVMEVVGVGLMLYFHLEG